MGMDIESFSKKDKDGNMELKQGALTLERMSSNILTVIDSLASNEEIFKLLYFQDSQPLNHDLQNPKTAQDIEARKVFIDRKIKSVNSKHSRILPFPFQEDAQTEDSAFIRVYYNQGTIKSNELIMNSQLHIDIICSKNLWLIEDNLRELGLIRPYAIFSRVIDEVGNRNKNNQIKVGTFLGFSHLTVNQKFECIRLYNESMQLK